MAQGIKGQPTLDEFFTLEDMYVNGRVTTGIELCETKKISKNKLQRLGGHLKILAHFGLEPSSNYTDINKVKAEKFKQFANEFLEKYNRLPTVQECVTAKLFGKSFPKTEFGGYKNMCKECGLKHRKSLSNSITFYWSNQDMIDLFVRYYGLRNLPTTLTVDADYNDDMFDFGVSAINDRFGTYENFIGLCGYNELSQNNKYSKKCVANDGHICDSTSERMIDDFLYQNKISHTPHVKYSDIISGYKGRMKCDFVLDDGVVIEYFGMKGNKSYDIKTNTKLKFLMDNGIKCIEVYPNTLNNLNELFSDYLKGGILDGVQCG